MVSSRLASTARRFGLGVAVAAAVAVAACGGEAPPPASPAAEHAPSPEAARPLPSDQVVDAPSGGATAPAAASRAAPETSPVAPPPPPPPPQPSYEAAGVAAVLRDARSDLARAAKDIEAAMGDCAAACRALASMERATSHLCALSPADERGACDDAKAQVWSARARIRAACGSCPDGQSLDRSAPIPSLR